MEPRIQNAKTADGVSIAFWTLGEGTPPLVYLYLPPFTHVGLEWQNPLHRPYYERYARKRRFIRFDARGTGLSERDVRDYSIDAQLLDIEAVVDRLGLETFALDASMTSGPAAITYAVRHPERLSHLILVDSVTRASDFYETPQGRGLMALLDSDWEMFTENLASLAYGWAGGESARQYATFLRECATPETAREFFEVNRRLDVTDLLPQIRVPTLVLVHRDTALPGVEIAGRVASRILDARFHILEEKWQEGEELNGAIDEFLGEGEEVEPKTELPEGMAVILFADIVESTALTEEMGDAAFREKARELDESLRAIIRENGGAPVEGKLVGDGVLAVFTSARQAIECALRCNAAGDSVGLQLHLGIHAGDVIREENNVYGGAVNIAARIAGASAPGEVLVSDTVRGLARTSAGVGFEERGEQTLKGIAEPQRLFAVRGGGA